MSKLYSNYLNLKETNEDTLYLIKCGIFYLALDEDAEKLSKEFGFKITKLNSDVVKCGFPENSLERYIALLNEKNIPFEIVDSLCNKVENHIDYIHNIKLKELVTTLQNLDMNNITFKQSFELLQKLQDDAVNIFEQ